MKWIDEKVLQKYFKESFKFYNSWFVKTYGENATSVKYNVPFDRYHDVWQYLVDFLWQFCGYAPLCVAEIFVVDA